MELIGTRMEKCTMTARGFAIGLLAFLLAGPAARAAGTYTLPAVLPLTGGAAFLGRAERQSLQLVQGQVNATGGIGGETLRFAFHDDQSSPQVAVQLANQLVAARPAAIIGSSIVAMCNAMAPLMARGPVMYCLSPGIHPKAGSFVFTSSVSTFDLARALVRYFRGQGWTRIAIITSSDATGQDADRGLAQIMREGANTAVTVVAHEHFNPTDVSVAAQIEAIKSKRPQALIAWTTGAPIATIFKGAVQGGLDIPVGTTDGNMTLAQMHQYAAFLPRQLFFPSAEWVAGGTASVADADVRKQQAAFIAAYRCGETPPRRRRGPRMGSGAEPRRGPARARPEGDSGAASRVDCQAREPCRRGRALRLPARDAARARRGQCIGVALGRREAPLGARERADRQAARAVAGRAPLVHQAAQVLIGGLLQGGAFAVVALGLSLVFRVTGVINLAQGGFCILGALGFYSLSAAGLPWPVAAIAAAILVAGFGALLGAAFFVPALARLPNSSMLMLTAGMMTLIDGLALVVWGSQPYAVAAFSGERPLLLGGFAVPSQGVWIAAAVAVIVLGTGWAMARSMLGRALLACAENPLAARLMGINVGRFMLASFAFAALIGALGGIVVAPLISVQFDTGRFFTNAGFVAVAIGGMQSFAGAVAGGLFLGVAQQLGAGYVSTLFSSAVALVLLLATLLWRPQGLFAPRRARREDVREAPRVDRAVIRLTGRGAALSGFAALAALALLPAVVGPAALASLVIALILFVAVLGLDVLMGFAGQVNLGQAGFMAIGGYGAASLAVQAGVPPLPATLAAMVVSGLCALLLAAVTSRLRGAYLALATLAFGLLVDALAVGLGGITGGPSGLVGIPDFAVAGFAFDTPAAMYFLVLGLIAALVLLLAGGMRSGFGRALQAIRTDQLAAAALGIDVAGHKRAAFVLCAALGSLAGSLYAFDFHFLSPDMVATPRSFELIAMLVLGGEGTLVGGLIGALLITLLPTLFQPLAAYKILGEGLILVLVFRYAPDGLLGSLVRALRARVPVLPQLAVGRAR